MRNEDKKRTVVRCTCGSSFFVIIQHPKITVRIQDEVLALRTYYNSYPGTNKARSASSRPTTRGAQHPESGVLNSYKKIRKDMIWDLKNT
jgi:hypothetical protein